MSETAQLVKDEAVTLALHSLRVEFAYCQERDFPLFGSDALRQMNIRGLCSQDEADAAIEEARRKVIAEGEFQDPAPEREDDDEELVGCESCENQRVPLAEAVRTGDGWWCGTCHAEWLKEYHACAHRLEPHIDEFGDACQLCSKCNGIVYPPPPWYRRITARLTQKHVLTTARWTGTVLQSAGVALLALHVPLSPWAYLPMLGGSALWTAVAVHKRDAALTAQQAFFLATNIVGAVQWLG